MTKVDKLITILLVVSILCLTAFVDIRRQNSERELTAVQFKLDSVQRVCDSLQDELLCNEITNVRYERAYQILLRRNPRAAEQYGNIISDETE
jgi:hypothetical protein